MSDVFEPEVRSYVMSQIRKTDTKPELIVRKFLFKNGFRYRIHVKYIQGNPDIVLKKFRTIIFVNGCFWHAHKNCKYSKTPKSNLTYWLPKIRRNVERDEKNRKVLQSAGWKVVIVWECELENSRQEKTLNELLKEVETL